MVYPGCAGLETQIKAVLKAIVESNPKDRRAFRSIIQSWFTRSAGGLTVGLSLPEADW